MHVTKLGEFGYVVGPDELRSVSRGVGLIFILRICIYFPVGNVSFVFEFIQPIREDSTKFVLRRGPRESQLRAWRSAARIGDVKTGAHNLGAQLREASGERLQKQRAYRSCRSGVKPNIEGVEVDVIPAFRKRHCSHPIVARCQDLFYRDRLNN